MDPASKQSLVASVKGLMQSGVQPNVKQWARSMELTCNRVGLLLSGDLQTAIAMASKSHDLDSLLTPTDKAKDLVVYSVSEEYFEARRELGLSVR